MEDGWEVKYALMPLDDSDATEDPDERRCKQFG